MKEIKLTQGKFAIVDDEDFEELSKHRWYFNRRYAIRNIALGGGKHAPFYMQAAIMGKREGLEIDHRNGDKLDNRRENLRHVTRSQNLQNQRPDRKGTSSQYKGVCWDKARKKWIVEIRIGGKANNLGRYESEYNAAMAYNEAAARLFGEYARLNIVEEGV